MKYNVKYEKDERRAFHSPLSHVPLQACPAANKSLRDTYWVYTWKSSQRELVNWERYFKENKKLFQANVFMRNKHQRLRLKGLEIELKKFKKREKNSGERPKEDE